MMSCHVATKTAVLSSNVRTQQARELRLLATFVLQVGLKRLEMAVLPGANLAHKQPTAVSVHQRIRLALH